jgi:hypothetical protein
MAAESTLFEIVYVVGPLLLSAAMLVADPLARWTGARPRAVSGPGSGDRAGRRVCGGGNDGPGQGRGDAAVAADR